MKGGVVWFLIVVGGLGQPIGTIHKGGAIELCKLGPLIAVGHAYRCT